MKFNLSNRIVMFSICSALEYDLKKFILDKCSKIDFSEAMIKKANDRNKITESEDQEKILNSLDLSDYVEIIVKKPISYSINNDKAKILQSYFSKIIPVRNRVMHTKPFELGDRSLLIEILESINLEISWINWTETSNVHKLLNEDPSKLLANEYLSKIDYDTKILHNLPEPEFDDTGYIGRKRQLDDIVNLLTNNKNQIISIIGNGGIGKTAIAVKSLYKLIDDPRNKFEAVIWISLKTKTLSSGEFIEIQNVLLELEDIYNELCKDIIIEDRLTAKENILNFMNEFKVLLVIDNLETINSEDINSFLKEIPEKSKVLITSRLGIGELEYRYKLEGMEKSDAIIYFRELSRYYGLDIHKSDDKKIINLVEKKLYSNPLSIKWFVSGIYNGLSEEQLLCKKNSLIEFCISNVYTKLNQESRNILNIFLIEDKPLMLGEIDFFVSINEINLKLSMNELLGTNMLTLKGGKYNLNDMCRDYLALYYAPSKDIMNNVYNRRKELNTILQNVRIQCKNDPYNPKSIKANFDNNNQKLASYYLLKALEYSSIGKWNESFNQIDKAEVIAPEYFEVFKIKAFIMAEKGESFCAIDNYKRALVKAENEHDKAVILYLFAMFYTIKLANYDKALETIIKAENIDNQSYAIKLEKSRILMMIGEFDSSENVLNELKHEQCNFDLKTLNIFACRWAELYRRKAEKLQKRDYRTKINYYKIAMTEIDKLEQVDKKTLIVITNILKDLVYLHSYNEPLEYMNIILDKYSNELRTLNHGNIRKIISILNEYKDEIPSHLYETISKYIRNYNHEAYNIEDKNKGIVVYIKDYYGFISNKYNKSIYFKLHNSYKKISVGDYVQFETYTTPKGTGAKNITKITQIF